MAQFDIHRSAQGGLLLDCQSDALGYLATRLVAPLIPLDSAPERRPRLNPLFYVDGKEHAMVTQYASTLRTSELGELVGNLESRRFEIINAFDMLLTGV